MRNKLTVRSVEIGVNQPKVVVPIVERSHREIMKMAENLRGMRVDMVEWRADYYDDIFNTERTLCLLSELRDILDDIPLLFTFRTKQEGGCKEISIEEYIALNIAAAQSGNADLIDVEIFSGGDAAAKIIDSARGAGVFVVGSNHDFHSTPPKDELVRRLRKMQEMDADILKIAVMPSCMGDVLTLLAATSEMYEMYADRPIVTISMSAKGVVSRLCGDMFGSAMTFGAVGKASAPGQIPVEDLTKVLDIVHRCI